MEIAPGDDLPVLEIPADQFQETVEKAAAAGSVNVRGHSADYDLPITNWKIRKEEAQDEPFR